MDSDSVATYRQDHACTWFKSLHFILHTLYTAYTLLICSNGTASVEARTIDTYTLLSIYARTHV